MIPARSKRMTVAQLKEQMDRRFTMVDQRFDAIDDRFDRLTSGMDAGFASLHDKMNAILRALTNRDDHQQKVLNEHEERLRDLERGQRARNNIPG